MQDNVTPGDFCESYTGGPTQNMVITANADSQTTANLYRVPCIFSFLTGDRIRVPPLAVSKPQLHVLTHMV